MPGKGSEILNCEQIRRDCYGILNQRPDIGAAKIISRWFFERPNIFDPNSRRKLKQGVLIVFSYFLLMAAVCAAFNLQ